MDHEFMTNVLADTQVGWDWMGLMLKDGRSVMVYRLRRDDGSVDFAAGAVSSKDGERILNIGEFSMTPLATWRSPTSKAEYPIRWRLEVPSEGIKVDLAARVADSELGEVSQTRYWEGPVASEGEDVLGYLEMTGYSGRVRF
jgi:predicted secreted hydrolase